MRLLALALLFPVISFADSSNFNKTNDAYTNAEKVMNEKLQKVLAIYPETKPQLEKAHFAYLNQSKSDCEFFAALKKNNLSRTHMKDCLAEANSNRANLYDQITFNGQ